MELSRVLYSIACIGVLVGCGHAARGASASQGASVPPLLIEDRGVTMPLEKVVTFINYRPWIPPGQALRFAVIPPLGNEDTPNNRGVAIEYVSAGQAMLISEWPKQNFALLFLHNQSITTTPCSIAHYKADGVAWTTRGKLAMTLQPDGDVNPSVVEKEARRLIAAGACS